MITPTAILLGNGPSVDLFDSALCQHVDVFGTNFIGVKFPLWKALPKGVLVTDSSRLQEIGDFYAKYPVELVVGDERRIVPDVAATRSLLGRDYEPLRQLTKDKLRRFKMLERFKFQRGLWRDLVFKKSCYSFDRALGFNFGNSVVIGGIQYLAARGYRTILLSGVDSRYRSNKDYMEGASDKVRWVWDDFVKNPRLFMEPHLVALQIIGEVAGVRIIDCTPGGALRFISKGEFLAEAPWFREL